jgi:exopolyphosphatase/guanosine-5'-triphosphate,3'-diphosphate pyrophosphatase
VYAAIDVGTNAVRLKIARPLANGALQTLHHERDPVRPGEGVFQTGQMQRPVADRLLGTLKRFAATCRRFKARVRAVATSAVREAKNSDDIVRRVRAETGILLDVVSGMEEARLICLGVLQGTAPQVRSLCLDIGGGSTEVALAVGERPRQLWSVAIGSVRLTDVFDASRRISPGQLRLMREYAAEAVGEAIPRGLQGLPRFALGSSGTIQAVVSFAASGKTGEAAFGGNGKPAKARAIGRAVDALVDMGLDGRRRHFDSRRADIIVAGAVILEALVNHLGLDEVRAIDRGLRDGILFDLMQRASALDEDHSLAEAGVVLGRRFLFDERHAGQVAKIALGLFDDLAALHRLPASTRPYLELAALLHDIGNAVSYQRHHKHTYYLIQNADIPGLAYRERELVARIARYHRRSTPEPAHDGMTGLSPTEGRIVRKLATLLRVADALDRSHHQPIASVRAAAGARSVTITCRARTSIELEMWDAAHEAELFQRVFGRRLQFRVTRARS